MASTNNQAFYSRFSEDLHSLVEQKGSHIRPSVKVEMATGEKHFFNRLGSFSATAVAGRDSATVRQDASHSRRMATIQLYNAGVTLGQDDDLKMLIDPTSDYVVKLARAHGRNFDTVVIDAMLGTAATGKDGDGTQAFDTSNQQIAHGSTGFTVAKFNQALRILEGNEVDVDNMSDLYLALGARGVEDLFAENNVISFDFQDSKSLSSGSLPTFRGVNIIRTQIIPDETADTTYRGLLYTGDTMRVAVAKDITVKTAEDLTHDWRTVIDTYMSFGAVRMEEETVVDVLYQ